MNFFLQLNKKLRKCYVTNKSQQLNENFTTEVKVRRKVYRVLQPSPGCHTLRHVTLI